MVNKIKLNPENFSNISSIFSDSLKIDEIKEFVFNKSSVCRLDDNADISNIENISNILEDINVNDRKSQYINFIEDQLDKNINLEIRNIKDKLEQLNELYRKKEDIFKKLDKNLLENISLEKDSEQGYSLTFSNIVFTKNSVSNASVLSSLNILNLPQISKLVLNNCDANTEELNLSSINKSPLITFESNKSKIEKLIFSGRAEIPSSISLKESEIGNFVLVISHKLVLKIIDTKIIKFDINISDVPRMKYFHFSSNSEIIENKRESYSLLQTLARNMHDTIQEHILYVKSLNAFKESKESNRDDKALIWLNDYVNKNGTSFIMPVLLLFVVNALFIFCMYYYGNINNSFLWNIFNINPVDKLEFPSNSNALQATDALRRILLTIFIFLTTSAALRFRFKK